MMSGAKWFLAGAIASYAAYRTLWQQPPLQAIPPAHPQHTFAEATAAAHAHIAAHEPGARPDCTGELLTHGRQTGRAIVLLHGFTNCPRQFRNLAEQYHTRGYNVFVPRFPYHGLYNRAPSELAKLTLEDLVRTGMTAVDIARGLGRHVTVMGLSMGGLVTAWLAHHRADIDRAVMVAPALAFQRIPFALTPFYATYARVAPNRFYWWDAEQKGRAPGPEHGYYGFHIRAFGALLRLAVLVGQEARERAPAARSLVVIVNPTDESIDNDGVRAVAQRWRRRGASVLLYETPAAWKLEHDLIDPAQPSQQIDRVYPLLIEWSEYPYYVAAPGGHTGQD
ncbi:MAG: alpha/beta fold hydrolase [Caldilinea sp.]